MRKGRIVRYIRPLLIAVCLVICGANVVLAETSSSSNYQVSETQFGSSSTKENCSGQYCARTSIGDLSVGNSQSGTSTASFGSITPDEPMLEVVVDPGASNLGLLDTEHTASKTMIVRVRNYVSNGYVLQITGDPPKYAGHTLAAPSSPTVSSPGTEQFAINAAKNTSPNIGATPVQVPSSDFSFGTVEDNYKISNQFQYVSEDVVARSLMSSGQTDYTISMIINISSATPAGHYSGDFSAVVIPVY